VLDIIARRQEKNAALIVKDQQNHRAIKYPRIRQGDTFNGSDAKQTAWENRNQVVWLALAPTS
jgi:hypothetical protein